MNGADTRAFGPWPILLSCLVLAAIQIHIFRWGVILPDTVEQYGQALSGHYADWHPPVMAWLWRQLTFIHPGSAPMLILNCVLYWSGIGLAAEAIRRKAGPGWAFVVVGWGLVPIWFGEMGSILKDSIMAALCLLITGMIALHPRVQRRFVSVSGSLCLVLIVLAAAMRFNAFLALGPFLCALMPPRWQDGPVKWGAFAAAGCGVLLLGNILINGVLLHPAREHPELSLITFDLAGMSHRSGDSLFPAPVAGRSFAPTGHCYTPAIYNPRDIPECNRVEDDLGLYLRVARQSAVSLWLTTIAHHPAAYLRHRLGHFNANQRGFVETVPEDAVYIMSASNPYGLHFVPGTAAKAVERAATAIAVSPLGRPATWLAVALGTLSVSAVFPSRRLIRMLTASALLYGGGYLIVSVAPDLRYNVWTMMAASLALLVALAERPRAQGLTSTRMILACVPVAVVVTAELLTLAA